MFVTLTVQRWGNSAGIRLPKAIRESLSLHPLSKLTAETRNGSIILTPVDEPVNHPLPNLEKVFADWQGKYRPAEDDFTSAVGLEEL